MIQPIEEKIDKIVTEGYRLGHLAIPSGTKWLTEALENLLEQERNRMSEEVEKMKTYTGGSSVNEKDKRVNKQEVLSILKH